MPQRRLFADAFYWVALIFPRDTQHVRVLSISQALGASEIVTTDEVLTEVLNHFSRYGPYWRTKAAALVHGLQGDRHPTFCPSRGATLMLHLPFTNPDPTRITA